MISAKGSQLATFKVQLGTFTKALEDALMVQLHAATAEWVKAVLKKIPAYTGTARGTFSPLSRVLAKFKVSNPYVAPVSPGAAKKKAFVYKGKSWDLGFYQGANYATHYFSMEQLPNGRLFRFEFINELPYVLWNDMFPAPQWLKLKSQTPWEAYTAGAEAFKRYCLNEIPRKLPSVTGLIQVQIISIR